MVHAIEAQAPEDAPAIERAASRPAHVMAALPGLGRRLRAARLAAAIPVAETARRASISASYYREIELGRKMPSTAVLARVAAALGLTLAETLDGSGVPSLAPPILDPRRETLQRLLSIASGLDTESLRSLIDFAGYLAHNRAVRRRSRGVEGATLGVQPLFPESESGPFAP